MSRKFLTPIDLSGLELQNAVIQNLSSAPTAAKGRIFFDSTNNLLKVSLDGSTFSTLSTGGGSFTLGSTSISLGSTTTTIAGLSSVTSTTFVGALTGNASTATTAGSTTNSLTVSTGLQLDSGTTFNGGTAKTISVDTSVIATKSYVDGIAQGINAHDAVKYATTGALGTTGNLVGGTITTTYNNNTTGVGATLTIATSSNWTSITIDGQPLTVGDRVLIKNQATDLQNGIYTVTTVGAVGNTTSFVFTRATDSDATPEFGQGDLTFVLNGTSLGNTSWVQTAVVTTVGSSSVTWVQFSAAPTGLTRRVSGTTPASTGTTHTITHNLNNQFVTCQIFDSSTGLQVEADVTCLSTTQLKIDFAASTTAGAYTYVIIG